MTKRMDRIKKALKMSSTLPPGTAGSDTQWLMGSAHAHSHSHHHHEHKEDGSCCGQVLTERRAVSLSRCKTSPSRLASEAFSFPAAESTL